MPTDLSRAWLAPRRPALPEEAVDRRVYFTKTRNLDVAVYVAGDERRWSPDPDDPRRTRGRVIGIRYKFDHRYLDEEPVFIHDGRPVTLVAETGFTVPAEIPLSTYEQTPDGLRTNRALFNLLDGLPVGTLWFVPGEDVYRRRGMGGEGDPRLRPDLIHVAAASWSGGLQQAVCGRVIGPRPYEWDRFEARTEPRPLRRCQPCQARARAVVLPER